MQMKNMLNELKYIVRNASRYCIFSKYFTLQCYITLYIDLLKLKELLTIYYSPKEQELES